MDDFKSNSDKSRATTDQEPERRVEAPITKARTRKRSGLSKIIAFFIEDEVDDIREHAIKDILKPALRNLIGDTIIDSTRMFLGLDSKGARGASRESRVSYRDYYDDDHGRRRDRDDRDRGYDLDDCIVDTRGDAERVIDKMQEIVDRYGYCRVADLYELTGVPSRWTDNKYGWYSVRSAKAQRVRDGYLIRMPNPRPLD